MGMIGSFYVHSQIPFKEGIDTGTYTVFTWWLSAINIIFHIGGSYHLHRDRPILVIVMHAIVVGMN